IRQSSLVLRQPCGKSRAAPGAGAFSGASIPCPGSAAARVERARSMQPFGLRERRKRSPPRPCAEHLTRVAPIAYISGFSHPRTVPRPRPSRSTPPDKTMTLPQRQPASRLEELLRARQFVITAEITPPVSCDADDLLRKALPLAGLADAVNVTDGASARAHLSAPIAAALLARAGVEPILQFTCRDRNRIALQADLMGAAACGVRNILCRPGDAPKAGDQPQAKAVFDVDSTTLTAMARDLRDKGELPSGRKVAGRAPFFLGAADVPLDPPAGWQPDKLAVKIAAGAEFVQTQFCMDLGVVRRYAAPVRARGDARRLSPDRDRAAALGEIGALDA